MFFPLSGVKSGEIITWAGSASRTCDWTDPNTESPCGREKVQVGAVLQGQQERCHYGVKIYPEKGTGCCVDISFRCLWVNTKEQDC